MRVLYPGSFDPLTFGHLDLIQKASELFGEVVVSVLKNPSKQPTFSLDTRIRQIKKATESYKGVEVISFDGLTVKCAKEQNVNIILRGLRALSDFEYELQIANTNRSLDQSIETVFLATEAHNSFLSSSVVKEVARFGGNIDHMVPSLVAQDLYNINKDNT